MRQIAPGMEWVESVWRGKSKRPTLKMLQAEVRRRSQQARPNWWTWAKCIEFLLITPAPAANEADPNDEVDVRHEGGALPAGPDAGVAVDANTLYSKALCSKNVLHILGAQDLVPDSRPGFGSSRRQGLR